MSSSDHDYALVVILNESESTGDKLTFTVQKVSEADLDPEQTRVAIIDNEGVQTKVALPASLVTPLNHLSSEGEDAANAYLQSVVLQSLESVAKSKPDGIDALESSSSEINIVLQGGEEEKDQVSDQEETVAADNSIFEDLSAIQNMLSNLKEKGIDNSASTVSVNVDRTGEEENSAEGYQNDEIQEDSDEISEAAMEAADAEALDSETEALEGEMMEEAIESIVGDKMQKYSKMFKCGFCDATYTTKYSLNIHIRHHTGEKPFKCTECDESFIRRSYLKYHMQNHTGVKLFQCTMCEMSYTSGSSLKNHSRTHTGEKPYQCSQCDSAFARKAYLNHHEVIAHQCALPYNCDQCNKVYKTKSSLRMHSKTHISADENHPNKCGICEKTFTRQHDLKRHILSVHEKRNRKFKCELCDMAYTAKGSLVVHMRSHTGEKPFECDLCGEKFARNTYMRIHRLAHDGKKPIKCEICDAGFTVMSSLNQHMRRHRGEKPFSCDICDAKFYRHRSAIEHRRVHTGEKPYACEICDKKFTWRCDMRRHIKTHSENKTFSCTECDASFKTDDGLKAHLQIHSGNQPQGFVEEISLKTQISKPGSNKKKSPSKKKLKKFNSEVVYACEFCHKTYKSLHNMKVHVKSVHTDKVTESTEIEQMETDELKEGEKKEYASDNIGSSESKEESELVIVLADGTPPKYDAKSNKAEKTKLAILTRGNLRSSNKK